LLFPSSADAYGASFKCGRALDERAPLAPMNVYGATKAAADLALGAMVSDGLRVIRARPFNHTGSGQSAEFVMPAFARQIARIEAGLQAPLLRVGALDSQRDFLDVRDVCTAYAACLSHGADLPPGTILNIASGIPRRIGDILDALRCLSGVEMEIETEQARLRVGDIPSATGDATEARIRLNWAPRIDWDQTLHDVLIDWRGRVASGE
jgi:nucleoside-diphosphate-sugar epimerase